MSVLLVIYNYPTGYPSADIINKIRSYQNRQLGRDSYAVETDESPQSFYECIEPYLSDEDTVYIVQMTYPIAGKFQTNISEWLNVSIK